MLNHHSDVDELVAETQSNRKGSAFDVQRVLHDLKHYLPSQGPLKDFIHHNSLHAFQQMPFYEGIFKAQKIFGYKVTLQLNEFRKMYETGRIRPDILDKVIGEHKVKTALDVWRDRLLDKSYDQNVEPRIGQLRANWKAIYKIDLDNLVQPLLFRVLCSYLDQGIALRHFPFENEGLLNAIRLLEKNSFTSFFRGKRAKALLFDPSTNLESLLSLVVGDARYFEQYLFDQQFSHRGWSGLTAAIEDAPHSIMYAKKISLHDLIFFELLLEIDALDTALGSRWHPLSNSVQKVPSGLFADAPLTELNEVLILWQQAFEWSYYDEVMAGLRQLQTEKEIKPLPNKTFQAVFCIDERECSLRRYIEAVDRNSETLGCPGFFGVEFYFRQEGSLFLDKLCPAPVTPQYLVTESGATLEHAHDFLYTKRTHNFVEGFMLSLSLGLVAAGRLLLNLFRPKMSPAISNAYGHMDEESVLHIENTDPTHREGNLQVGFTVAEMATRVENLLKGIGLVKDFAPIVYLVSHGSSTANNPYFHAYDCGACSGRPGATNARVFAFMANHQQVRAILDTKGLIIPENTQFVGGMHDTAADEIRFYDAKILRGGNVELHEQNLKNFEAALDLNAQERSRRFASIDTKADLKKVREAIRRRSVSMFEPRPELGHGTNALCFVGKRSVTKGLFLDRRAFLNSYDCTTDPDGKLLLGVMRPLPIVCGGINLEYYFSRVDNYKMGAGTKLPHNVMGLIAVANSSDGDARPGLPWQMIEPHDPVRLMLFVEHKPEVVLKTIQSEASLYEWFINDWVHLTAIHPETGAFYYFDKGQFRLYEPLLKSVKTTGTALDLIHGAAEMLTNNIVHATEENIAVHVIQ